ncbi:hypothetical protein G9A89_014056 [Geosiphon pyriformis]|nr:hypothetical protein G9A89_014056 [Geosiphon pyriformis]
MAVISLVLRVALLNNETGVVFFSSKRKIAARDLLLEIVAGGILLVSLITVFEFVGVNRLLVAVVNILLVAMVDKLEFDILVVDRLAAALLAGM